MNERIRELEAQAWEQVNRTNGLVRTEDFNQKFALLIIEECADTAYESLYEYKIFDDSPYNIRCHVMDAIKKHFGVK